MLMVSYVLVCNMISKVNINDINKNKLKISKYIFINYIEYKKLEL